MTYQRKRYKQMVIRDILRDVKTDLRGLYGNRLRDVILYGSWARGEATADSDIDLAVVLQGQVSPGQEIDRMIDAITDLNLKHGILISVYPVSEESYATVRSPLLINIHREGVPA